MTDGQKPRERVSKDQLNAFEERMEKKKSKEVEEQAEKDLLRTMTLREQYLRRTGRKNMTP